MPDMNNRHKHCSETGVSVSKNTVIVLGLRQERSRDFYICLKRKRQNSESFQTTRLQEFVGM